MSGLWIPPGPSCVVVEIHDSDGAVETTVPCPICGHPMPADAAVCTRCAEVVTR